MTRVAIFTTYVPSEGFGGPARVLHQRRVLEAAGHQVVHVVVQPSHKRGDTRDADLVEVSERPYRTPMDHIYNDVDLGRRAADDKALIDRVRAHLRNARTEAVILEQPYLVDLTAAVANDLHIPVVYSSANIEYRLRRDLERFQPDPHRRLNRSQEVRELEARAVALSAEVTSICAHDQAMLREEFGCDSLLVPNGTTVADHRLPPIGPKPSSSTFAFSGSAYWPNIEGFVEIATPSLAFLPPTCRIEVGGTVGPELLKHPAILRHQSVNSSRMTIRGFLSMEQLVEMMAMSTAVLVPVFLGEGSNLKSADALACGAPVIMTSRAVRGYEDVLEQDASGVEVVDTARDFRRAMSDAVTADHPKARPGEQRRALLSWSRRLEPLVAVVARVTS